MPWTNQTEFREPLRTFSEPLANLLANFRGTFPELSWLLGQLTSGGH